jgi:hypothetical protein
MSALNASTAQPLALFARWLGCMLLPNLAWEIAQLPLYRLPPSPFPYFTAYAVAHCTVGDVLIAAAIYAGASVVAGLRWPLAAPLRGLVVALPLGIAYTAVSEWRNVYVVGGWAYDAGMPTLAGIGLSPLAQWLLMPPLVLWLLRRTGNAAR